MSQKKKAIRKTFRDACFARDNYSCAHCGFRSSLECAEDNLDAHHITPREHMPNGGYVKENGISLCAICHVKAEDFLNGDSQDAEFSPDILYRLIGSSREKAVTASEKLANR